MKTCLLLAIVFLAFQITAQIKINVNGKNISVKGKNSNSQKGSDGNGNTNIEENSNKNNNAYNFETNPDAPVSVNNNILAGNSCVVIDSRGNMSRKKVYQVVEGGYAIIDANATDWDLRNNANAVRYFAANSVYPDVDFDQFSNDCSPYKEYVRHYLKCYSANHLPSMEVLKGWESNFPEYMLGSVKEVDILGNGVQEREEEGEENSKGLQLPIGHTADPRALPIAVPHSSGPRRTEPDRKVLPRGLR